MGSGLTLRALWDAEYANVLESVRRRRVDHHSAEEITSTAFQRIAPKLPHLTEKEALLLLPLIVHGAYVSYVRYHVRRPSTPAGIEIPDAPLRLRDQPFVVVALDNGIRALPEDVRDAWILTHLRGLSTREAGEILDLDHSNVVRRNSIANSRLQEEL
jgi:DNA-directed RNA polymerase specialized sigma24 family protein